MFRRIITLGLAAMAAGLSWAQQPICTKELYAAQFGLYLIHL